MINQVRRISFLKDSKIYKATKLTSLEIIVHNLDEEFLILNLNLKIVYRNDDFNSNLNKNFENVFLNYFEYNSAALILFKIKNSLREIQQSSYASKTAIIFYTNYEKAYKQILLIISVLIKDERILIKIKDITKKVCATKRKAKLLNNISHELRTPLFNIQSFIETLTRYINKLEKQNIKEFLMITKNEVLRLNKLVNTILEISKVQSNNSKLFDIVDIIRIINQLLKIYSIRVKKKKIKLKRNIKLKTQYILTKNQLILQILDNLLANAFKFSLSNSQIILRAYTIKGINNFEKTRLEIGDLGIGISKKYQLTIFKRFFRIEEEIKIVYGTGLGLNIVKKILQKYKIDFYLSTSANEGTIFLLDFKPVK